MNWINLKTTSNHWEAEFMQQVLSAYEIPCRIVNHGIQTHFGCSTSAVVQVLPRDRWTALLLLSPVEDDGAISGEVES